MKSVEARVGWKRPTKKAVRTRGRRDSGMGESTGYTSGQDQPGQGGKSGGERHGRRRATPAGRRKAAVFIWRRGRGCNKRETRAAAAGNGCSWRCRCGPFREERRGRGPFLKGGRGFGPYWI